MPEYLAASARIYKLLNGGTADAVYVTCMDRKVSLYLAKILY